MKGTYYLWNRQIISVVLGYINSSLTVTYLVVLLSSYQSDSTFEVLYDYLLLPYHWYHVFKYINTTSNPLVSSKQLEAGLVAVEVSHLPACSLTSLYPRGAGLSTAIHLLQDCTLEVQCSVALICGAVPLRYSTATLTPAGLYPRGTVLPMKY